MTGPNLTYRSNTSPEKSAKVMVLGNPAQPDTGSVCNARVHRRYAKRHQA